MNSRHLINCFAAIALTAFVAGCGLTFVPGLPVDPGIPVPDFVTVRVFNNTDFDVDPGIEFGVSENELFLLDTGIVASGEIVEADFDCDEIIVLTATEPAQLGNSADFVLDSLPFFEIDFDFFCGELVVFEFVGNGQQFDVFVDAGGENIF